MTRGGGGVRQAEPVTCEPGIIALAPLAAMYGPRPGSGAAITVHLAVAFVAGTLLGFLGWLGWLLGGRPAR